MFIIALKLEPGFWSSSHIFSFDTRSVWTRIRPTAAPRPTRNHPTQKASARPWRTSWTPSHSKRTDPAPESFIAASKKGSSHSNQPSTQNNFLPWLKNSRHQIFKFRWTFVQFSFIIFIDIEELNITKDLRYSKYLICIRSVKLSVSGAVGLPHSMFNLISVNLLF